MHNSSPFTLIHHLLTLSHLLLTYTPIYIRLGDESLKNKSQIFLNSHHAFPENKVIPLHNLNAISHLEKINIEAITLPHKQIVFIFPQQFGNILSSCSFFLVLDPIEVHTFHLVVTSLYSPLI